VNNYAFGLSIVTVREQLTNGKQEGCEVDITSSMYAKRKYKEETFTIKGPDFTREGKRAI